MNDSFPVLHALHTKKIKAFLLESYPKFVVGMDGTPFFAKAECFMIRVVHRKTKRIHKLVIHIGLDTCSLDGATIARNVKDTLMGCNDYGVPKFDLRIKHWKANSIDLAGQNKKAMEIMHEDHNVKPFLA